MEQTLQKIKNFRDLEVWQLGKQIVSEIYQATATFPKEETYGLTVQMRKAAVSIPSNIAEGFNRSHNAEYRQFLNITLGSCAELETQIEISADLGFLDHTVKTILLEKLDHEQRMIRNLIKRL